jgi:hypothetical protein
MLRVFVSIVVLVALTSAYVISPPLGWSALGTTFMLLVVRRARKVTLDQAGVTAR